MEFLLSSRPARRPGARVTYAGMFRPFRLLFQFTTLVSYVLFVALIVSWVRSYRAKTVAEFWWAGGRRDVTSAGGRVWLSNDPQRRLERQPWEQANRLYAAGAARYESLLAQLRTPRHQREIGGDLAAEVRPDANTDRSDEKLRRELVTLGDHLSRAYASAQPSYRSVLLDALPPTPPPFPMPALTARVRRSCAYWLPTAAAAVLPAVWLSGFLLARRRRRRRLVAGACVACGYDLRVSSGRCPECGAAVPRRGDACVARAP